MVERIELDDGAVRVTERCSVCQRRHFTLSVPPIHYGVEGAVI